MINIPNYLPGLPTSNPEAIASSSKALGELLRSPKHLRPISLSSESMTLKSPLSTLHTPPLAACEHPSALMSEQAKRAKRVDADRSLSRWKRNLSICSERIATRKGTHSDPYVKLGELLVEETLAGGSPRRASETLRAEPVQVCGDGDA
ncbi:hypothetical protein ZIOFF_060270 [Zingiber officinale]|uniref:Uncharacterized protein n=1 Tax=Zingiber officinale TaxID=94328 RepID=A0A8J5KKX7_ZINOF|nr:hypothetical protein ZIOFF_060270 [Zingiber officinale]